MKADREVDLLIAGAGPAGMAAALVASLEGLDVLLCEKSDQVEGTVRPPPVRFEFQATVKARRLATTIARKKLQRYLDALIGHSINRELRTAYLRTGPVAIDYFERQTDVKFPRQRQTSRLPQQYASAIQSGAPWFGSRLTQSSAPRFGSTAPCDLRFQSFLLFGGMMVGKADIPPLMGGFKSIANFVYSATTAHSAISWIA